MKISTLLVFLFILGIGIVYIFNDFFTDPFEDWEGDFTQEDYEILNNYSPDELHKAVQNGTIDYDTLPVKTKFLYDYSQKFSQGKIWVAHGD